MWLVLLVTDTAKTLHCCILSNATPLFVRSPGQEDLDNRPPQIHFNVIWCHAQIQYTTPRYSTPCHHMIACTLTSDNPCIWTTWIPHIFVLARHTTTAVPLKRCHAMQMWMGLKHYCIWQLEMSYGAIHFELEFRISLSWVASPSKSCHAIQKWNITFCIWQLEISYGMYWLFTLKLNSWYLCPCSPLCAIAVWHAIQMHTLGLFDGKQFSLSSISK